MSIGRLAYEWRIMTVTPRPTPSPNVPPATLLPTPHAPKHLRSSTGERDHEHGLLTRIRHCARKARLRNLVSRSSPDLPFSFSSISYLIDFAFCPLDLNNVNDPAGSHTALRSSFALPFARLEHGRNNALVILNN
jgi:hypothetical protein